MLQPRDRRLLSELEHLKVVSREQASVICGFGSRTRANARLLNLTEGGYLRQILTGTIAGGRRVLYALAGIRLGSLLRYAQLEHQLTLNAIYLQLAYRQALRSGIALVQYEPMSRPLVPEIPLVPDAYAEFSTPEGRRASFLEVDRGTEALSVWHQKTARYLALATSGAFSRKTGLESFRVLVVAPSERRLENLRREVAKQTSKVFWFASVDAIQHGSIWEPVWLRPNGEQRLPLF